MHDSCVVFNLFMRIQAAVAVFYGLISWACNKVRIPELAAGSPLGMLRLYPRYALSVNTFA